jgi:hypothetical protein
MATRSMKSTPHWGDVKASLAGFDRDGLLKLVQDLYAANRDNQAFLHARLGLGGDVLEPFKATISRWLWPDVLKNQDMSLSKAQKAVADYKKAVGQPGGLAELMTFYCEQAAGFYADVGMDDEVHFDALLRMFGQALAEASRLPAKERDALLSRLDEVRRISHDVGYGVGDEMGDLLAAHGFGPD